MHILSTTLFSISLNDLIKKMKDLNISVLVADISPVYAYDMVLLLLNEQKLQINPQCCRKWCRTWGLEISSKKIHYSYVIIRDQEVIVSFHVVHHCWTIWICTHIHGIWFMSIWLKQNVVTMTAYASKSYDRIHRIFKSPPGQNGHHFADDIVICTFLNEKFCILINISLKFVPRAPIDNSLAWVKIIVVLPVGWNWHEMYLWLLPNEIRPCLGQTCTSISSGIVEVQNDSLGGHFPNSAFALWQVRNNNCIFFSHSSLIVLMMPRPTSIGIRHKVLALAHEGMQQSAIAGRVGLTHATFSPIL